MRLLPGMWIQAERECQESTDRGACPENVCQYPFLEVLMNIPKELKYEKTDEWLKVEGKTATIGISDYAQEQLSDIVYVDITLSAGDKVKKGSVFATIESVKAAADVNMPVSGTVLEVNTALSDTPEKVNSDPYASAWMVKVEMDDPQEAAALMDSAAYEKYCAERTH
jgi:glycine cleavage system H protein